MRGLSLFVVVAIAIAALSAPALATTVGVEVLGGNAWHSNQRVNVGGHEVFPRWTTRPFTDYPYFSARIRWAGIFELEWLHDKVYMGYDTDAIRGFNISDGYNFALINVVQAWGPWEGRLGGGPIIVHPEGVVNGYPLGRHGSPSWRVGGIGFQLSGAYRGEIWRGLSWVAEAKATTAVVHLMYPAPVHEVYVPVTGAHLLIGVGYDF